MYNSEPGACESMAGFAKLEAVDTQKQSAGQFMLVKLLVIKISMQMSFVII